MRDDGKTRKQLAEELSELRRNLEAGGRSGIAQAEIGEDIARLDSLYTAINKMDHAIARTKDPGELSKEICRIAVEDGKFRMVWLGLTDPETKMVVPVASWGVVDGYLDNVSISIDPNVPEGRGPTGIAGREGTVLVCADFQNDPRMKPWSKEGAKRGYRSSAAFPLSAGERIRGVLTLYSDQLNFFTEREVRLIKALCANIYFAFDAREFEARQKQTTIELKKERDFVSNIFDTVDNLIIVLDTEGRIVSFNRACEQITGYKAMEALGKPFWDFLLLPEEIEGVKGAFAKLKAGDFPNRHINHWVTKEGALRLLEWHNTCSVNEDGTVKYLVGTAIDITEHKKTDDALIASENRYRRLFEAAKDGILILDANTGMIADANPYLIEMMGFSHEELSGKMIWEIGFFKDIFQSKANFFELQQKNYIRYEDLPLKTADGRQIDVEFVSNVYEVDHQRVIQCNIRNITERKKAENIIKEALDETKQQGKELEALLSASRTVLDSRTFEDAAKAIYHACKELLGATAGYIALQSRDGSRNEVAYLDTGNIICTVDPNHPMPIRGFRDIAYRAGRAVFENDFQSTDYIKYLPKGHAPLENVLFAPLIIDGAPAGLLGLGNKPGGFTDNDARMAQAFGEFAAIALKNSRATELLESSEQKFRSVSQTAPDAIITIDSAGKIVFWNRGAQTIFGYDEQEALGKPVTLLIPKMYRADHSKGIDRVLVTGKSRVIGSTTEMAGLRKDGSEFPLDLSLAEWESRGEKFFSAIIRDITTHKQTEAELKRHRDKLEFIVVERTEAAKAAERKLEEQRARAILADRLRSLGEMAAGIAHELNQPLLGVRGLAEHVLIGLERGWKITENDLKERVKLIVEQADRMSHIIEHVRLYSREANGAERLAVNLNDVVKSCVGMLGSQLKSRGYSLECNYAENLPDVLANPFSLEEVMFNLVNNARDAIADRLESDPKAPARIEISTYVKENGHSKTVKVDISDTGMGIPKDVLDKIFDPFFTTKGPDKGTGLGLPISKAIIEGFSGDIEVQTTDGAGTKVTISLPSHSM